MLSRTSLLLALAASASLAGAIVLEACNTGSPAAPDDTYVPEAGTEDVFGPGEPGADADVAPGECGGPPTLAAIQTGIFSTSCAFGSCHGGANAAAGLDLTPGNACASLVNVASCEFASGTTLVVPGDPAASYLYRKVVGQNLGSNPNGTCAGLTNGTPQQMPLGGTPLCAGQIEQIQGWIQAGASCTDDGGVGPDDGGSPPFDAATGARDGGEPTVAQIASTGSLTVGGQIDGTVTLSAPAPAPGLGVLLNSSAAMVVAVPSAVLVAAGKSTGTFAIQGISSGNAAVQAVTVGDPVSMNVQVASAATNP